MYIGRRESQSSWRLWDIISLLSKESDDDFRRIMGQHFRWLQVNKNHPPKSGEENLLATLYPEEGYDENDNESIKYYFEGYLPAVMGTCLGRAHRLGLRVGFRHGGNWTIVGSPIDLDSVRGKLLYEDDDDPTDDDYEADIDETLKALFEIEGMRFEDGQDYLETLVDQYPELLARRYNYELKNAQASMLVAYLKERYGDQLDLDLTRKHIRVFRVSTLTDTNFSVNKLVEERLGYTTKTDDVDRS